MINIVLPIISCLLFSTLRNEVYLIFSKNYQVRETQVKFVKILILKVVLSINALNRINTQDIYQTTIKPMSIPRQNNRSQWENLWLLFRRKIYTFINKTFLSNLFVIIFILLYYSNLTPKPNFV